MSGFRVIPLGAAIVALVAALAPVPAAAQTDVFLELRPNTIQAGFQIGVVAGCGDDLNPAIVESSAFGEITLSPDPTTGLLTGAVVVPSTTAAGGYQVGLRCADGATASAELFVLDMARPTRGPDTGGGGTAGSASAASVLLAAGSATTIGVGAAMLLTRRRARG